MINNIDPAVVRRGVVVCQALSHEVRLQICAVLLEGEASVTAICEGLNLPQHKVSQQLAILRNADVVTTRRQSRQVFYSIGEKVVTNIVMTLLDQAADEPQRGKSLSFEAGRFAEIASS